MVGGLPGRGVSLAGGLPGRGVSLAGGLPGGVSLAGVGGLPGVSLAGRSSWQTPPVNRMTDACENITLPQTPFAGGNNAPILNLLTLVSSEGRPGSVDDDG